MAFLPLVRRFPRVPRAALLSAGVQGQLVLVQLAISVLLAKMLGPAGYGDYSFAWAIVLFIQIFPNTGLEIVIVRFTSTYRVSNSWRKLKGLWRFGIGTSIAYGILAAGGVLLAALFWGIPSQSKLSPNVLMAMAAPLLALPLVSALGASVRGIHHGILGQLPQFSVRPLVFLCLTAIIFWFAPLGRESPAAAIVGQGAAGLCAAAVGFAWMRRKRPVGLQGARADYEIRRWMSSGIPAALAGSMMLISTQADILMLGTLGTAHATGVYKVASQAASLVAITLTAANLLIAPRIAGFYAKGDFASIQKLLRFSVRACFSVAFFIALLFWIAGKWLLLSIFGMHYLSAFVPLAILCTGQLINVGAGSVGVALLMTGHEKITTQIAVLSAVVNVLLNFLLIPRLGSVGAAIATTTTMLFWNGVMALNLWRRTGLYSPLIRLTGA